MLIREELYQQVKMNLPIPCVDLLIINASKEILLVKRANEPAKGQWWFPGGRVLHGESRKKAVLRKLGEECGIKTYLDCEELNTHDLFLEDKGEEYISHGITTVYKISVEDVTVVIDDQGTEYEWRTPQSWMSELSSSFPREILSQVFS
ncbi:MAG: NUDIX domain-containing protein [Flavobacteriales bacterium]|nr:NUDIX domain-containing protein [Flavobacteriales bacterium]